MPEYSAPARRAPHLVLLHQAYRDLGDFAAALQTNVRTFCRMRDEYFLVHDALHVSPEILAH